MKKNKTVILLSSIILVLLVIITILLILLFNKNENYSSKGIAGIYSNNTWNGKGATLVINDDYTCEYPTGSYNCTWKVVGNTMTITLKNYIIKMGESYGATKEKCETNNSDECQESVSTHTATVGNGAIALNGHTFVKVG